MLVRFTATASFGAVKLPSATLLTPMDVMFFGMCLNHARKKLDPLEHHGHRVPWATTPFPQCFDSFKYETQMKMKSLRFGLFLRKIHQRQICGFYNN